MFKNSGILNIPPLIFYNWCNFDLCAGRELNLSSSWDELHTRDMPWLQGLELTFQQRTLLELSQHLVIIFWQKEVNNLEEGRTADKIIQRSRAFQEGCPAQGLRSSPGRQIALGGGRSMKTSRRSLSPVQVLIPHQSLLFSFLCCLYCQKQIMEEKQELWSQPAQRLKVQRPRRMSGLCLSSTLSVRSLEKGGEQK